MKVRAILNREGGTLRTADVPQLCKQLEDAFREAGHEVDCRPVGAGVLREALEEAFADDICDWVIAGGGDGTISLAAGMAWKSDKPLGVLPAGTMNLFARSLAIPLDLGEAISALARGRIARVDIATANGRPFVHQFSVGIQPRMVAKRKAFQYGSRLGKIIASVRALLRSIMRPSSFSADLSAGDREIRQRMSLLAISNNPHGEGHIPYADRLDTGLLGVYYTGRLPPRAGLRLATDLTLGNWSANPDLVAMTAPSASVRFPGKRRFAKAVIDGELIDLQERINIEVHPGELPVLVPSADHPTG